MEIENKYQKNKYILYIFFSSIWGMTGISNKYRVARTLEPRKAALLGGGPFSQKHSPVRQMV